MMTMIKQQHTPVSSSQWNIIRFGVVFSYLVSHFVSSIAFSFCLSCSYCNAFESGISMCVFWMVYDWRSRAKDSKKKWTWPSPASGACVRGEKIHTHTQILIAANMFSESYDMAHFDVSIVTKIFMRVCARLSVIASYPRVSTCRKHQRTRTREWAKNMERLWVSEKWEWHSKQKCHKNSAKLPLFLPLNLH